MSPLHVSASLALSAVGGGLAVCSYILLGGVRYRLRCKLGAWCLKWHAGELIAQYGEARIDALGKGDGQRADRCSYICIGVMRALGHTGDWKDARRRS